MIIERISIRDGAQRVSATAPNYRFFLCPMRARWRNVARLARALGVPVPKGHGWRRRYVTVRRIAQVLDKGPA